MLPSPNLDDRTFKQIVDEARRMIPRLMPQWTDENYHDPGITFVELFAWLTEMQQYYLDQVTERNELKFLKLLGVSPRKAACANSVLTAENIQHEAIVPRGAIAQSGEQCFEVTESVWLLPVSIKQVISVVCGTELDFSHANLNGNSSYYAFGKRVNVGNQLVIGFDGCLPSDKEICLSIELFEDYPVKIQPLESSELREFVSGITLKWQYTAGQADTLRNAVWKDIEVLEDETCSLNFTGRLIFKIPGFNMKNAVNTIGNELSWLRCTLVSGRYELSPKISGISLNNVKVKHGKTYCEYMDFSGTELENSVLEVEGSLPSYGKNQVQIHDGNGNWKLWKQVDDFSDIGHDGEYYKLENDEVFKKIVITFGDGRNGKLPPKGNKNIRVISYLSEFEEFRVVGMCSKLPGQRFRIAGIDSSMLVTEDRIMLQIAYRKPGENEYSFQDWEAVDDFSLSKGSDKHFLYDAVNNEIVFGNGENGAIPGVYEDSAILLTSLRTGGGESGNVKENEINVFKIAPGQDISVNNRHHAEGGKTKETIEDAKKRLGCDLKRQYRAVTCEDYECLAMSTPGLRVARVKALPLFEPGIREYPVNTAPCQLTLVVVPYSEEKLPVPGKAFLDTVRKNIDKYRLVTTELYVIPPEYVRVTVHAVVVVAPHLRFDKDKILKVLDNMLDPLGNRTGSVVGWPFGRPVYKGDIFGAINKLEGVEYIKELWLEAEGRNIKKDVGGDIIIPPYSLVYSGIHDIDIVGFRDI